MPPILLLMLFTAGNLLPQQVIIVPLYRIYLLLPNPLQFLGDAQHFYDAVHAARANAERIPVTQLNLDNASLH